MKTRLGSIEPKWHMLADLGFLRLNGDASDGGSGDTGDDDAQDDGATDTDAGSDDAGGDQGDDGTNEPETLEEALEQLRQARADKAALERVRRNLDRRTKKDKKTIDALQAGRQQNDDADTFDADAERETIRAEIRKETALERARDKAEAALAGKVTIKPSRAVALLGDALAEAVGDDGEIDGDAIADAIEDLLEENPGLRVARGDTFQGDADQGGRGGGNKSEEQQLEEQLKEAEKANNFAASIAIKQRLAAVRQAKKKG